MKEKEIAFLNFNRRNEIFNRRNEMDTCTSECELYPMTDGCIDCRHYQLELLIQEEINKKEKHVGSIEISDISLSYGVLGIDVEVIGTLTIPGVGTFDGRFISSDQIGSKVE